MPQDRKFKITIEEGNTLFRLSNIFLLPDKMADTQYGPVERVQANEEIRQLRKTLKSYSPLSQGAERVMVFGPPDCWEEVKGKNGEKGWKASHPFQEIEIKLSEDAISGAVWLMIAALAPETASNLGQSAADADDVWWPLSGKLGKSQAVRKAVGLDKSKPRRWEDDADIKDEKNEEAKA